MWKHYHKVLALIIIVFDATSYCNESRSEKKDTSNRRSSKSPLSKIKGGCLGYVSTKERNKIESKNTRVESNISSKACASSEKGKERVLPQPGSPTEASQQRNKKFTSCEITSNAEIKTASGSSTEASQQRNKKFTSCEITSNDEIKTASGSSTEASQQRNRKFTHRTITSNLIPKWIKSSEHREGISKLGQESGNLPESNASFLVELCLHNGYMGEVIQFLEKDRSTTKMEILMEELLPCGMDKTKRDKKFAEEILEKYPKAETKELFASKNRPKNFAELRERNTQSKTSSRTNKPESTNNKMKEIATSNEIQNSEILGNAQMKETLATICEEIQKMFQLKVDEYIESLSTASLSDIKDATLGTSKGADGNSEIQYHSAILLGTCQFMPKLYMLLGPIERNKCYYFISVNMEEGYEVMDHFTEIMGKGGIPFSAKNKREYGAKEQK